MGPKWAKIHANLIPIGLPISVGFTGGIQPSKPWFKKSSESKSTRTRDYSGPVFGESHSATSF